MDGGNTKEKAPHRDRIVMTAAPFRDQPREIFETGQRFRGMRPLKDGKALVEDYDRNKRVVRTMEIDIDKPGGAPREIWSRNEQDHYRDPGNPQIRTLPNGQREVMQQGDDILFAGHAPPPPPPTPFPPPPHPP